MAATQSPAMSQGHSLVPRTIDADASTNRLCDPDHRGLQIFSLSAVAVNEVADMFRHKRRTHSPFESCAFRCAKAARSSRGDAASARRYCRRCHPFLSLSFSFSFSYTSFSAAGLSRRVALVGCPIPAKVFEMCKFLS